MHTLDGSIPVVGQEVSGRVDWKRRLSLMRHHTATHILLGAVRRVLGEHSWQAGAEKEEERSRLDVSHWDRITPEQLVEIERLANDRVMDNIPVEVNWLQRDVAEKLYGFRLYQGGVVPGKEIRVVKIGDWDVEACGGTHLRSTGEVGPIKILHTERIQDGVERLVFASGRPALEYIQGLHWQIRETSELLSVPAEKLVTAVRDLSDTVRSLERKNSQSMREIVGYRLRDAFQDAMAIGEIRLVTRAFEQTNAETLIEAASSLVKERPDVVLALCGLDVNVSVVVMAGENAVQKGINCGAVAAEMARTLGGGGGGRPNFGQGGGTVLGGVQEALKLAEEMVRRQVGRPSR